MSVEEGRLKRKRDDNDGGWDQTTAVMAFFGMPDVVHYYVSPFLKDWKDHWALARVTSALWRYYHAVDRSTRVMFYLHNVPFGPTNHLKNRWIMDSGDMRLMEWLWNKKRHYHLTSHLAKDFCLGGARTGSIDIIRRFVPHVAPEALFNITLHIFQALCKFGWDDAAIQWLSLQQQLSKRDVIAFSVVMANHANRVPKTFDFLKRAFLAIPEVGFTEKKFLLLCLLNSCMLKLQDGIEAFGLIWQQCLDCGMDKRELMNDFLRDLLESIEGEMFSTRYSTTLERLPLLCKIYFQEYVTTSHDNQHIMWKLEDRLIIVASPHKKQDDVMTIAVTFFGQNLRLSRTFNVPKSYI